MNAARALIALTIANVVVLAMSTMNLVAPSFAQTGASVLRGRSLEIVDEHDRVRASIGVLPAGTSKNGDAYPETVLLRLITERGRPSVKISTSEEASGVSFAGPSGTKDTYVILEAKDRTTSLKLRNEDGRQHVVMP
jgi:hypothetical protein